MNDTSAELVFAPPFPTEAVRFHMNFGPYTYGCTRLLLCGHTQRPAATRSAPYRASSGWSLDCQGNPASAPTDRDRGSVRLQPAVINAANIPRARLRDPTVA